MPTAQVFDAEGKGTGTVELPAAVFGIKPHAAVVHEVLIAQLANRRAGTGGTKTRGEVSGSTRKIWRQKGTGRARHGSRKAPIFVGGGITFGPRPRDYTQKTPQKVRHLAVRSALSAKAAAGQIVVIEPLALEEPRTKVIAGLLRQLPAGGKTLIVTPGKDAVQRLFNVRVMKVNTITIHGRQRRRGQHYIHTSGFKKAVVTLAPGQKIDLETLT